MTGPMCFKPSRFLFGRLETTEFTRLYSVGKDTTWPKLEIRLADEGKGETSEGEIPFLQHHLYIEC
jgi:hypothetical protein